MSIPSQDPPPSRPPSRRTRLAAAGRWLVLGLIVLLILSAVLAGGATELGDRVRANWITLQAWVQANFILALLLSFLAYVLVTGLSIPVANVMTIAVGALFGRWVGLVLISVASTAGATLAFLGSRYLFRDVVQRQLGARFEEINRNITREGAFYLFTLRLMVVVPFWMVNLAAGLTTLPTWTFWWVSQVGMLPATFLYIQAGAAAGEITDWRDIFSPAIVVWFALLGVMPLALRWVVQWYRRSYGVPG